MNNITPGEVGIIIKNLGENKGMQEATLNTGLHCIEPFIYDVVSYDTRLRQELLENVQSNTKDGQPIAVDVSFEYGLLDRGVPGLHENVGKDYFTQVIYLATRSAIRNTTSTKSSDEIYTGIGRAEVQAELDQTWENFKDDSNDR